MLRLARLCKAIRLDTRGFVEKLFCHHVDATGPTARAEFHWQAQLPSCAYALRRCMHLPRHHTWSESMVGCALSLLSSFPEAWADTESREGWK